MFNVSGYDTGEGNVSYRFTHDVKARLSLRWAHMRFFCLIDALMFHFNEPRLEKIAACKLRSAIPSLPKSDISCP